MSSRKSRQIRAADKVRGPFSLTERESLLAAQLEGVPDRFLVAGSRAVVDDLAAGHGLRAGVGADGYEHSAVASIDLSHPLRIRHRGRRWGGEVECVAEVLPIIRVVPGRRIERLIQLARILRKGEVIGCVD